VLLWVVPWCTLGCILGLLWVPHGAPPVCPVGLLWGALCGRCQGSFKAHPRQFVEGAFKALVNAMLRNVESIVKVLVLEDFVRHSYIHFCGSVQCPLDVREATQFRKLGSRKCVRCRGFTALGTDPVRVVAFSKPLGPKVRDVSRLRRPRSRQCLRRRAFAASHGEAKQPHKSEYLP